MITGVIGVLSRTFNHRMASAQGFTLLENLVSILLLGLTLCAGMVLYYNGDEIVGLATHKKIITEAINREMEDIRTAGYHNIPDPGNVDVSYFTVGGLSVQKKVMVDYPPDGASDYKQIRIEAHWSEAGSNSTQQITLTTFVAS